MAGFRPNEGEAVSGQMLLMRGFADRDADLEIGLFTTVAPGETITEATIVEPAGNGYARKTLTDASWSEASSVFSYATQTFTPSGGDWVGVQGYFIATKSAVGTQRLLVVEVDGNGPYTIANGNDYAITPQITIL